VSRDSAWPRYTPGPILRALQCLEFPRKLGLCERLFARALARRGICWAATAAGVEWKLDLANATHRWIVYGKYEGRAFLDWARRNLPTDAHIVDSGANIGQMLLYLAQWVPHGRVLAIEPGREASDWLAECLQKNPALPVELLRCALGAAEGTATLQPVGDGVVHGACNRIAADGQGEPVALRPLAALLAERGWQRLDLWKLDVEGSELQALAGAERLLRERRIAALYVELGFGNGERIRRYLADAGYTCHLFGRDGRLFAPRALPAHVNGLFVPR
jgi:FkbM family methyltransferase